VVVTPDAFKASLTNAEPPQGVSVPLAALWWAAKGDWNKAHVLVQPKIGADASWVHAYLHRREGEMGNAAYWYRRADKPYPKASSEEEWEQIVAELLGGEGG
jgi:hypothetical protein